MKTLHSIKVIEYTNQQLANLWIHSRVSIYNDEYTAYSFEGDVVIMYRSDGYIRRCDDYMDWSGHLRAWIRENKPMPDFSKVI